MATIKDFIETQSQHTLTADDKSMYRALRRFHQMDLVDFRDEPSNRGGPDRKVYALTETGLHVLNRFIQKNIIDVYYQPEIIKLMKGTV